MEQLFGDIKKLTGVSRLRKTVKRIGGEFTTFLSSISLGQDAMQPKPRTGQLELKQRAPGEALQFCHKEQKWTFLPLREQGKSHAFSPPFSFISSSRQSAAGVLVFCCNLKHHNVIISQLHRSEVQQTQLFLCSRSHKIEIRLSVIWALICNLGRIPFQAH